MTQHDRVTLKTAPPRGRSAAPEKGAILQRKCACGGSGASGDQCEDCKKKEEETLQRASRGAVGVNGRVSPTVHRVLSTPGRPLENAPRAFVEARMGRAAGFLQNGTISASTNSELTVTHPGDRYEKEADSFTNAIMGNEVAPRDVTGPPLYDLSRIRIHNDRAAADAAEAVNAYAFTVGHHLVFGAGSYNQNSVAGLRLIAHELAHTLQQAPGIARQAKDDPSKAASLHAGSSGGICLGPDICNDLLTPSKLLEQAAANPQNQAKREHRKQMCHGVPPPAACTADGHGAPATQAEKLLHGSDVRLPAPGVKMIVDKDMEQEFGGLTISCDQFVPPITGARCITIPESMELQAAQFNNTMDPTIAGKERGLWRERTLEILVHESAHARFREALATRKVLAHEPRCANQDTRSAMSELVAMLNEFPLRMERIRTSVSLSSAADRDKELEVWRNKRIRGTRQSITVSLRTVRCACACADAEKMIKEAIEFATASWSEDQKGDLHREMHDPLWTSLDLRWPFAAPATPSIKAPPASGSSASP